MKPTREHLQSFLDYIEPRHPEAPISGSIRALLALDDAARAVCEYEDRNEWQDDAQNWEWFQSDRLREMLAALRAALLEREEAR